MYMYSLYIYIYILLKVWSDSCYSEADDTYKDCLGACCKPLDPGEQITCCNDTGVIVGICFGVFAFIIIVLRICFRIMNCNASK